MTSEKPLKISVIGINYAPERSGIAPYTAAMAEGLAAKGHHVRVLTTRPHYPEWRVHEGHEQPSTTRHGTLVVKRLRNYIPAKPRWRQRILFEISFGLRALFANWGRPDLVICVSPALIATAIVSLRVRFGLRRPASGVIVQDLYSRGVAETADKRSRMGQLALSFEGRVLAGFGGVVVIHERFKSQVARVLGVAESRIDVIRNWTHTEAPVDVDVERERARLGWGEETVVLHAGAMGVKQGLENVVEAARFAEEVDAPVRFVLLGDGSQRESLAAAAEGVSKIEFRDQVDSDAFTRTLAAADVLLVNESPGLRDMAVPSKLTTYFRAARPIVAATDERSTTADELAAAETGVRVPPGSPRELVDAVLEISGDPQRARSMAERGVDYCQKHLTADTALRKYAAWVAALSGASQSVPSSPTASIPSPRPNSDHATVTPQAPASPEAAVGHVPNRVAAR